jgi:hypothetical protein
MEVFGKLISDVARSEYAKTVREKELFSERFVNALKRKFVSTKQFSMNVMACQDHYAFINSDDTYECDIKGMQNPLPYAVESWIRELFTMLGSPFAKQRTIHYVG